MTRNENDRLLTRDVCLVMAATFCFMASNMLLNPLMTGYAEELGAGGALMGVVAGMMNVVALFCRPIAGNLSDKVSKRMLVGVGSALYLLSNIWYMLAGSPGSLIAARMLNGIGFACCSVCLATWMSMLLPIRHMGAGMGLYGTMNALAMAVGPAVGIRAQQVVGYRSTFAISMVLAVLMVVSTLMVRNGGHPIPLRQADRTKQLGQSASSSSQPQRPTKGRISLLRRLVEPRVVPLSMVFMMFTIPYFANQAFLVVIVQTRHLSVDASLFFPLYAVVLLVLRIVLRDLFDRKSFGFFLVGCSVCMIGMLGTLTVMSNDWMLLAAGFFTAGSYGIMSSVTQSQAVIIAGKARSGIANSTYYMGIDLGMALGPMIGGFLYGHVDAMLFYPLFMVTMPLAWLVYLCFARHIHARSESTTTEG